MPKVINLTGQKFGRLTVLQHAGNNRRRQSIWLCQCSCGATTSVLGFSLTSGNTKSCGCLRKFSNFFKDMGKRPSGYTLDRIDNNSNYCKTNCVWSTRNKQSRNRRNNTYVTFDNKTLCIADWSEKTGISPSVISWRLKHGWSIQRTLTESVKSKGFIGDIK